MKSFIACTQELLSEEGDKYVLSSKLNQDPLEQYFSKQRAMGGANETPDVRQFGFNHLRLVAAGSTAVKAAARGNITLSTDDDEVNILDLPMSRRQTKKC